MVWPVLRGRGASNAARNTGAVTLENRVSSVTVALDVAVTRFHTCFTSDGLAAHTTVTIRPARFTTDAAAVDAAATVLPVRLTTVAAEPADAASTFKNKRVAAIDADTGEVTVMFFNVERSKVATLETDAATVLPVLRTIDAVAPAVAARVTRNTRIADRTAETTDVAANVLFVRRTNAAVLSDDADTVLPVCLIITAFTGDTAATVFNARRTTVGVTDDTADRTMNTTRVADRTADDTDCPATCFPTCTTRDAVPETCANATLLVRRTMAADATDTAVNVTSTTRAAFNVAATVEEAAKVLPARRTKVAVLDAAAANDTDARFATDATDPAAAAVTDLPACTTRDATAADGVDNTFPTPETRDATEPDTAATV